MRIASRRQKNFFKKGWKPENGPWAGKGLKSIQAISGEFWKHGHIQSKEYPDDCAPDWLYTKALLYFIKTGSSPEASALLGRAKKYNPHVPDYLTGRKIIPDTLPDMIKAGGEDEGYCYAEKFLPIWRRVPGAIDWLNGRTGNVFSLGGADRNLPCPCGSGKKYKKCCGKTVN